MHLLRSGLYRKLLNITNEDIDYLMDVRQSGISTREFELLVGKAGLSILAKKYYLVNPIYEVKFGMKHREQLKWVTEMHYIRDFVTTCAYNLIEGKRF